MGFHDLSISFASDFADHLGKFSFETIDPEIDPNTLVFSEESIARHTHEAWDKWLSYFKTELLASSATIEILIQFKDGIDHAAEINFPMVSKGPNSSEVPTVYHELLTGEDLNGDKPDAVISVGEMFGTRYGGMTSVMEHELGHALGFIEGEGRGDGTYLFDLFTEGRFFVGSNAIDVNGGPVPLLDDCPCGHITPEAVSVMGGNSLSVSELDAAILADLGLPMKGFPYRLRGSDDDDRLVISDGVDEVDGGGGRDTALYDAGRVDVTTVVESDRFVLGTSEAEILLVSIERVEFEDGALLFDIESFNAPAAYRLYGGAFARTPDEDGFLFWVFDWLDAGRSLHDAAAGFIASPEFIGLYGSDLTDAQMVDQLYLNVLGRPGETEGVAFWNDYLANGHGDHADVLVHFTQLPEYVENSQADIANGYWVV